VARELRELPPLLKDRNERDDPADVLPDPERRGFSLRVAGPDHSLSVATELSESSISPTLPLSLPALVEAEPDTWLKVEELALISFSLAFSFSSKSMKIRERASLYAASRSSIVMYFLWLPLLPVVLLRPPWLPVSEGSMSDRSASSPAIEPYCEAGLNLVRSC